MGNSKSKRNNHEIVAQPAGRETADGTLQLLERKMERMDVYVQSLEREISDQTVQLIERRLDKMYMVVQSLQGKIDTLDKKRRHFEKSADEAIGTYASNVQLIMMFHGLGCVFLQVNYPYAGAGLSFVMVVSFFSAFMVAYMVTLNKIERMSEFENNLQKQQIDLQNEVTRFGVKAEAPFSEGELENLPRRILERLGPLKKGADALQKDLTRIIELSNSNNIRTKSLSQVAAGAIIYGLCFPTIASYFLCLVDVRRSGLGSMLQQY